MGEAYYYSMSYAAYYCGVWSAAILAIPACVALPIVAIVAGADGNWGLATILGGLCGALLFYTVYLRSHSSRVLVRAGAFPAWGGGDVSPRTEAELLEAVRAFSGRSDREGALMGVVVPSIVGSGWGFFLKKKGPPAPRIFMHRFTGRSELDKERFKAGTTVASVITELEKEGKTLASHPTMDYISLGSWFALGNHGNEGPCSPETSSMLEDARVLNLRTGEIYDEVWKYEKIRKVFDTEENRRTYCIVDVKLKNVVSNRWVQKQMIEVRDVESARAWLQQVEPPMCYLRMLFLGGARSYGVGMRWTEVRDQTMKKRHKDPHCCSRWSQFVQVDVLSTVGGCIEPPRRFTGVSTLANANRWMPPIFPLQNAFILLAGYYNFEVFFRVALTDELLWQLVRRMIELHKQIGGRSEIRHRGLGSHVCLDVSLRGHFDRVFELLNREPFGVREVALHLGKFTSDDPVKFVKPCELEKVGAIVLKSAIANA